MIISLARTVLIGIAVILLIIFYIGISGWPFTQNQDVSNWVTLTAEIGVGILVALVVYVITHFQQKEIRNILRKQDTSKMRKEIRAIRQIIVMLRFSIIVLDNLQSEIEERRKHLDLGSDKRMIGYRDSIRNIVKSMQEMDLSDLESDGIIIKANSIRIAFGIFVDHWDRRWDIHESRILTDIDELLTMLHRYTDALMPENIKKNHD